MRFSLNGIPGSRSKPLAIIVLTLIAVFCTIHFNTYFMLSDAASALLPRQSIPNFVHYVYVLEDLDRDLIFHFSEFLSMYAAWYYWRPDAIYLHTNAPATTISRARTGLSGKWSKLLFEMPSLRIVRTSVPKFADNGVQINGIEHKSDFVRVQALRDFGGIYIDFDAHPLRDVKVLRECGFNSVGGRQFGGDIMSGTFMSKRGSSLMKLWADGMQAAYDGGWTTHSNAVITRIGEGLVASPGEMLIMEREAFGPGSWEPLDCISLYETHNDSVSAVNAGWPADRLIDGKPLHDVDQVEDSRLSWAIDWSKTYILHAFSPHRSGTPIDGFTQITPRYVLERRSNFARAVFPVAKVMYEKGLISVDDAG